MRNNFHQKLSHIKQLPGLPRTKENSNRKISGKHIYEWEVNRTSLRSCSMVGSGTSSAKYSNSITTASSTRHSSWEMFRLLCLGSYCTLYCVSSAYALEVT